MNHFKFTLALLCCGFPFTSTGAELANLQCPEFSGLQKIVGVINFLNIFEIIIFGIGFWSLTILFPAWYKKLQKLFVNIPPVIYEAFLYASIIILMITGLQTFPNKAFEFALTSSLLLPLAILYSSKIHQWALPPQRLFIVLMIAWGATSLLYANTTIGFLSVAALMGAIGFSVSIGQLCYMLGFKNRQIIPTATTTALVVLALFVTLHIAGIHTKPVKLFESGAFWLGSLVMYSGLLILSTKRYGYGALYLPMQILTVIAGITALSIGNVWNLPVFRGVGSTFLILYLIQKPFEIPFEKKESYAAMALILSLLIGTAILWVKNHIDLIQPYLLF